MSALGDLTLQISKSTTRLLELNYHVDQLFLQQHQAEKEKEIQQMLLHAASIKDAADKIMCEVQYMSAKFEKYG